MNIMDLFALADEKRIPVDFFRMGYAQSLSVQDKDKRCYIALDLTTFEGASDLKVHFAHELGHCMSGGFYTRAADALTRRKAEAKADAWAIERLLPKDEFLRRMGEIDCDPHDVAEHFGVPVDFLHAAVEHYARKIQQ